MIEIKGMIIPSANGVYSANQIIGNFRRTVINGSYIEVYRIDKNFIIILKTFLR
jgi:hypothetical protein